MKKFLLITKKNELIIEHISKGTFQFFCFYIEIKKFEGVSMKFFFLLKKVLEIYKNIKNDVVIGNLIFR